MCGEGRNCVKIKYRKLAIYQEACHYNFGTKDSDSRKRQFRFKIHIYL
jgi:hypothetical protein